LYSFNIQHKEGAWGCLNKRPQADTPPSSPFRANFTGQRHDLPQKRRRKTSQLPQFRVYQDQILSADTANPSGQNEPTPSLIGRQIDKIWPHISVEIPFRPEFHSVSATITTQNSYR
jgi:hypothetical protein